MVSVKTKITNVLRARRQKFQAVALVSQIADTE